MTQTVISHIGENLKMAAVHVNAASDAANHAAGIPCDPANHAAGIPCDPANHAAGIPCDPANHAVSPELGVNLVNVLDKVQ